MKYKYKDIYLEETIEEIFCKLNNSNTEYNPLTFSLIYKPYEYIQVFIYLIVGKILLIKIFDENFQIDNTLKVGIALTDEIINRYDLYYDDFEEVYLSKKYKELVVIVDLADNIIGFSFVKERGEEWDYPKDKIKNYLECKNLQDIYGSLCKSYTLDANIEKREIYGQLDNYKFTFDIITRDIKSIQNLETGEFVKTSLEQIEIKINLKFLILKAMQIENIYIAFSIVDPRLDITVVFEGTSEDLGYKVKVIYTEPSNSPQLIGVDKNGNKYIKDGTAYVDKKTGIGYILVNTESPANSTKAGVIGTIAEEQSHVIGKFEGRQKTVPDGSEKGLESLGRPTNDYFKNQYSKNDKAIGLKSDGKDYSNVDFGENVGDNNTLTLVKEGTFFLETGTKTGIGMAAAGISVPAVVGIVAVGGVVYYFTMPEEKKEQLKEEISEIYEDVKKSFGSILDKESSKNLVADVIKFKLKEKGIEADVKIDKDGNVMYTLSPLPEDMKKQRIPPIPLPEEEKNPRIPPMDPPKEETEKEKWEREERARREEQEFFNELQKPNGIPILKEEPVNIIKSQVKPGDVLETPDNAKDKNKFRKGKNEGDSGYENLEDGSWWERDVAGDRAHSGSGSWKRWPKKPDRRHKKKDPDRRTINNEGKVLRR